MNWGLCWIVKKRVPLCVKLAYVLAASPNISERLHGARESDMYHCYNGHTPANPFFLLHIVPL